MDLKKEFEFMTDDEIEEMMDSIVLAVGELAEEEDSRAHMLSVNKLRQLQFTDAVMRYLLKGTDAKITDKLYQPYKSMGSVIVEGKDLSFTKAEWFARAAEFSSNVDIYPLTNGKIRMVFTFHGLTEPIE